MLTLFILFFNFDMDMLKNMIVLFHFEPSNTSRMVFVQIAYSLIFDNSEVFKSLLL